jgi:hypothetical protein
VHAHCIDVGPLPRCGLLIVLLDSGWNARLRRGAAATAAAAAAAAGEPQEAQQAAAGRGGAGVAGRHVPGRLLRRLRPGAACWRSCYIEPTPRTPCTAANLLCSCLQPCEPCVPMRAFLAGGRRLCGSAGPGGRGAAGARGAGAGAPPPHHHRGRRPAGGGAVSACRRPAWPSSRWAWICVQNPFSIDCCQVECLLLPACWHLLDRPYALQLRMLRCLTGVTPAAAAAATAAAVAAAEAGGTGEWRGDLGPKRITDFFAPPGGRPPPQPFQQPLEVCRSPVQPF